jgi:hypothetical protein
MILDIILLSILMVSAFSYFYIKYKQKKSIIVISGVLLTIVTMIFFVSAICTILNFIFKYLI